MLCQREKTERRQRKLNKDRLDYLRKMAKRCTIPDPPRPPKGHEWWLIGEMTYHLVALDQGREDLALIQRELQWETRARGADVVVIRKASDLDAERFEVHPTLGKPR